MAVPKRKMGRARTHARRSTNDKIAAPARSICPQCGEVKLPHRVCGNCDREPVNPEVLQCTLDGVKFFCTHGDRYGVKYTLDALLNAAYFAGADIVLFGHTHRALSETTQGLYVVNPGTAGVGAVCTYACIETRDGAIRSAGIHAIPEA